MDLIKQQVFLGATQRAQQGLDCGILFLCRGGSPGCLPCEGLTGFPILSRLEARLSPVLSPPCYRQAPGSRWPRPTSRQGPQSLTASSPTPSSLPSSLNGLLPQFPFVFASPPRAGDEPPNSAHLPGPLSNASCCPDLLLRPGHNLGSWSYPGRAPPVLLRAGTHVSASLTPIRPLLGLCHFIGH